MAICGDKKLAFKNLGTPLQKTEMGRPWIINGFCSFFFFFFFYTFNFKTFVTLSCFVNRRPGKDLRIARDLAGRRHRTADDDVRAGHAAHRVRGRFRVLAVLSARGRPVFVDGCSRPSPA